MRTKSWMRRGNIAMIASVLIMAFTVEALWPLAAESRANEFERPVPVAEPIEAAIPMSPHVLRVLVVREEARRAAVPPEIALAVSMTENWGGDSLAVSRAGAVGVMQVMPRIWRRSFLRECGDGPLTSLRRNACVGVRILAHYHRRHGNWNQTLRAYNGSLGFRRSGDRYVAEVLDRLAAMDVRELSEE